MVLFMCYQTAGLKKKSTVNYVIYIIQTSGYIKVDKWFLWKYCFNIFSWMLWCQLEYQLWNKDKQ